MPNLPSGTITFLFTDIEGSTKLWEQHPEAMRKALARHDELLRQAIEQHNGYVFKTVGDAFCAAFATAPDALAAALAAHLLLRNEEWGETDGLRVRMGLHTGVAEERDGDYFGPTLNRVARLQAVGHGQQTLLSQTTYHLVCHRLPAQVTLQDMGQHRLKDLLAPEHVWQLRHPDLPSEFPPLKSLDALPNNLPRQVTSFIGRAREMAEVKRLLPSTPLLTLVGAGGAGKTRLALQAGAEVLDDYKDGVWLVELAALSDPDLVPQTVATALGLREEASRPLLQSLQDYLRDRQLLLILDNCEHLVDACARLADALLKNCPHLTILATSREVLGIAGEQPWRVPSLLTPGPADLLLEEKDVAAALLEYDACRLFVERAVVQRQDFVLTRSNVPVVAHLCQQLDGIPLAIELAAARVRSLSVEQINDKLNNRFRLLTGGSRTALGRQQTLRSLVDWSFNLLNDREKTLLCRLSVFAGGWTLEAAEAVVTGIDVEDWEVLDLLTSLVDKSLVVVEHGEGQTRYRLLETIRQYARDRLEECGEGEIVRERHQAFFLALAEEAEPQLVGPEQAVWLDKLEREHDNLRAALEWGMNEAALRLSGSLMRFWYVRGSLSEGRARLTTVLNATEKLRPSSARVKALNVAGGLSWTLGDYEKGRTFQEQSLALGGELDDKWGTAISLNNLGLIEQAMGNYGIAQVRYEESLVLRKELHDVFGISMSLNNLAQLVYDQGNYTLAEELFTESLQLRINLGDQNGIALLLCNLGHVKRSKGDYNAALKLYKESLAVRHDLNDKFGVAYSLEAFAALTSVQEQSNRAAILWGAAEALREAIGAPLSPPDRVRYDRQVKEARAALDEETFAAAWREGRAMTMERAIEYALEEPNDA